MEGHIILSRKEQHRHAVYPLVDQKAISLKEAAKRLGISYRQAKRQYRRFRESGAKGLVHRLRGRPSNHRIPTEHRTAVLDFYRNRLKDFNLQHASEKLEAEGLPVHPETLRLWLKQEGEWTPRRRTRGKHRSRRERRPCFGDMVQLDGSFHDWLGTGEYLCLMVMIDDATNHTWCQLYEAETSAAAMTILRHWVRCHGIPGSLYTDKKNVYHTHREPTIEEQLSHKQPRTAFGAVCDKLAIRLIPAHSPQAKGRVERENGTLQDRLTNELRYHGIHTIEEANRFIQTTFLPDLNRKFSKEPASATDAHRPATGLDLDAIFSWEYTRKINNDWTVRIDNRYYQLTGPSTTLPPCGRQVTVQKRLDGGLHILYRGRELSYHIIPTPARSKKQQAGTATTHPWLGLGHKPSPTHPWRL